MIVRAQDLTGQEEAVARDARPLSLQPGWRLLLGWCAFVVAYFAAYRYGMSFGQTTASPFWFPDPILLCALLLMRPRHWWMFVVTTLPIRLLTSVPPETPLWFLLVVFTVDSVRAMLTATLLRRFLAHPTRLETVRDFALFFAFAVVLVPAVTALGGAAARSALGYEFWPTWQQWFMGNALAHVVITPAILYWIVGLTWNLHLPRPQRIVEGALLIAGLITSTYLAFESQSQGVGIAEPAFYAPVPFLFWAAIRYGMLGASGAIVVIAIIAVHAAINGHGPFAGGSPQETALYLQNFLLWRAAPLYLVAILIAQKNDAEVSLRESEARFRRMADFAPALIWMSNSQRERTYVNQRWLDFTGRTLAHEQKHGWLEIVHPEDRERCLRSRDVAFEARAPLTIEYQLRRRDGQYCSFLEHAVPRFTSGGAFLGFIGSCIDITEMRETSEAIKARTSALALALREREVLLSEIHHRVKNNLQLVSSLLALQARGVGLEAQHALAEGQRRIDSIALVHEQLYGSRNLSAVNFARYTEALIPELCRASGAGERVEVVLKLEDVELVPERAIPCGLLVSELVTNALKHAFPDQRRGSLTIELERLPASRLRLSVKDDGIGLRREFPDVVGTSLGLDLVQIFAKQLQAEVVVEREGGTCFRLTFEEGAA